MGAPPFPNQPKMNAPCIPMAEAKCFTARLDKRVFPCAFTEDLAGTGYPSLAENTLSLLDLEGRKRCFWPPYRLPLHHRPSTFGRENIFLQQAFSNGQERVGHFRTKSG